MDVTKESQQFSMLAQIQAVVQSLQPTGSREETV